MSRTRGVVVGAVCGAATAVLWASTPGAVKLPAQMRAEYTFDDASGGVVRDVSGRGHDLTLSGAWRVADGLASPAVAFAPTSYADTPHRSDLNPGGQEFAWTVRFRVAGRTSDLADSPNLAQKGFYADDAQYKMQLKPSTASVQCRFEGTRGAELITSPVERVDDGEWHTATCWRAGDRIGVTVDGIDAAEVAAVGDIANTRSLRIGARSLETSTDQFVGAIDYVGLAVGEGAALRSRVGNG